MKPPSDHLRQLIQRMTPAEKRYFKVHFASDKNRLTAIYDLLNTPSLPNDAAIMQTLAIDPAQYKVLKVQLLDLLLKSLAAGRKEKDVVSKLLTGLEEVEILLDKELFALSQQRMERLAKLARQYGFTLFEYLIAHRMHEIKYLEIDASDPYIEGHFDYMALLQQKLVARQNLTAIQLRLEEWNTFTPMRREQVNNALEELERMPPAHLDIQSELNWLQNKLQCYIQLNNEQQAEACRQAIADVFERNPSYKELLPLAYLRTLKHLADSAAKQGRSAAVAGIEKQARRIVGSRPQYSPHLIYFMRTRLEAEYENGKWSLIVNVLADEYIAYLVHYDLDRLPTAAQIYLVCCTSALLLEQHDKASRFLADCQQAVPANNLPLSLMLLLLEGILLWQQQELETLNRKLREWRKKAAPSYSPLFHGQLDCMQQMVASPLEVSVPATDMLTRVAEFPYDALLPYYTYCNMERWLQALSSQRSWRRTVEAFL